LSTALPDRADDTGTPEDDREDDKGAAVSRSTRTTGKDPRETSHPAGEKQAAENTENEQVS
jgi:hypothetical protein